MKKKCDNFAIKHTLTDAIDITSNRSLALFSAPAIFASDDLEARASKAVVSYGSNGIWKSREGLVRRDKANTRGRNPISLEAMAMD